MTRSTASVIRLIGGGLLCLSLVLAGCSSSQFPAAPNPAVRGTQPPLSGAVLALPGVQPITPGVSFALSPSPRSKPTASRRPLVDEGLVRARKGGQLTVESGHTLARFTVPANALEQDTRIRMEVIGEGASTLVRFGPSGLQFLKPATLALSFPAEGMDIDGLGGYLIDENGAATPVPFRVEVRGNRITVSLSISHFSLYSPSDGDDGH